jgi:hypothetical protein
MKRDFMEMESPRESGWEDQTRALGANANEPVRSPPRELPHQTRIRVTRLETKAGCEPATSLVGAGHLIERLSVGHPLRIAVDESPAFVTSAVRGVRRVSSDAVEVTTNNSVYRIERFPDEAAGAPMTALPESTPVGASDDSTSFVRLATLRRLGAAPFDAEQRYRITRLKTHDPGSERLGDLGTGRILDPMDVGDMVRVSLESGPTFVTSPLRAIRRVGDTTVELDTANSTYRLLKVDTPAS